MLTTFLDLLGLALLVAAAAVAGFMLGGELGAVALGAFAGGVSCLALSWAMSRGDSS